ncbi:MAG: hypothetical protein G01um101419_749 [Parcubacteria group bacterium Gr01-1014_19]|nr:MAG: hypothetical protein G01um101419_749 [Parcubacteria group bacterium Gr01-1014_19]
MTTACELVCSHKFFEALSLCSGTAVLTHPNPDHKQDQIRIISGKNIDCPITAVANFINLRLGNCPAIRFNVCHTKMARHSIDQMMNFDEKFAIKIERASDNFLNVQSDNPQEMREIRKALLQSLNLKEKS